MSQTSEIDARFNQLQAELERQARSILELRAKIRRNSEVLAVVAGNAIDQTERQVVADHESGESPMSIEFLAEALRLKVAGRLPRSHFRITIESNGEVAVFSNKIDEEASGGSLEAAVEVMRQRLAVHDFATKHLKSKQN